MIKKLLDWPPIWMLLSIGLAILIAKLLPVLDVSQFLPAWTWIVFLLLGAVYAIWAEVEFLRAKTSVIPRKTPSSLITTGPFKISRNPIYTGFALIILAVCLKLGALLSFVALPLFVWVIQKRFIAGEEKTILDKFPDEAAIWFENTRRW